MKNDKVELGDEVKCKVTGFRGVVTSIAKCLTGCDRCTIQPPVKRDGKHPDAIWVDVACCEIIKKSKVKTNTVQELDGPNKKLGGPPTSARGFK